MPIWYRVSERLTEMLKIICKPTTVRNFFNRQTRDYICKP